MKTYVLLSYTNNLLWTPFSYFKRAMFVINTRMILNELAYYQTNIVHYKNKMLSGTIECYISFYK